MSSFPIPRTRMLAILHLDPRGRFGVRAALQLRDDPFEVVVADDLEQRAASAVHMIGIEDTAGPRWYRAA